MTVAPESPVGQPGHEVHTGTTPAGHGIAICACGEWEAVVTGLGSAQWAYEAYVEHLRRVGLDVPPG